MATWTTDILGSGLAHHAPTKQERVLARRIARRWKMWQPLLVHELRQRPHPPGHVARELLRLEHIHAKAIATMMAPGDYQDLGRWGRVCRLRLDDPRWTDEERAWRFQYRTKGTNPLGPATRPVIPRPPKRRRGRPCKPIPPPVPPPHPRELSCERFVESRYA